MMTSDNQGMQPQFKNESQEKSFGFAQRMVASLDVVDHIESTWLQNDNWWKITSNKVLPNALSSPEFQQYTQAQRDFINAVLRRESGAAISKDEFANAEKQYFVQAGDSKEVIAQKRRNRRKTLDGIIKSS